MSRKWTFTYSSVTFVFIYVCRNFVIAESPAFGSSTVQTILSNGHPETVFDLVLLGEGYTASELNKFEADVARVTSEGFGPGGIYFSISPFLNIHSIFEASEESGVGMDGKPLNTVFRLFREKGKLRSILPSDENNFSYDKALKMCKLANVPGCDVAIILVNDPFYGGLGDEVAILSASKSTGMISMRHELGHIFADIGEEYDGGDDYSGANFALTNRLCTDEDKPKKISFDGGVTREVWECISWSQWLTSVPKQNDANIPVEDITMLYMKHPWKAFDRAAYSDTFKSAGEATFFRFEFSLSGAVGPGKVFLSVDEKNINEFPLPIDNDRHFFHYDSKNQPLTKGVHRFSLFLQQLSKPSDAIPRHGPATISHVGIWEYGEDFEKRIGYVGAFPVFEKPGVVKGYRPVDNSCLMRSMESKSLCPVCRERIWQRLAERTRLMSTVNFQPASANSKNIIMSLVVLPFGKNRPEGHKPAGETVMVKWERCDLSEESFWMGESLLQITVSNAAGCWQVHVQISTPEVRKNRIVSSGKFFIPPHANKGSTNIEVVKGNSPTLSATVAGEAQSESMVAKELESNSILNVDAETMHVGGASDGFVRPASTTGFWSVLSVDGLLVGSFCVVYMAGTPSFKAWYRRKSVFVIISFVAVHFGAVFLFSSSHNFPKSIKTERNILPAPSSPTESNLIPPNVTSAPSSLFAPLRQRTHDQSSTNKNTPDGVRAPKKNCRSAHSGPHNAVDDEGYICPRTVLDPLSGCCAGGEFPALRGSQHDAKLMSKKFQCESCNPRMQCCKDFEMCISCCMGHSDLNERFVGRKLLSPVQMKYNGLDIWKPPDCFSDDVFLKCKCRCRTHSQLTRHENAYESPYHFCYHKVPPSRPPAVMYAGDAGESCNEVCARHGNKVCEDHDLIASNTCEMMKMKFPCGSSCQKNRGSDQPAYDLDKKKCLLNNSPQFISCSGLHVKTRRLCPCREKWG